tara:strand:+ start:11993 stop:12487 length:495 start_codon:yes stop_codon:yes gene_type:complete
MSFKGALFSSNDQTWRTPSWLFNELNEEFNFDLDAAAHSGNKLCSNYISPEEDALKVEWEGGSIFCNPPYGKDVGKFVKKAYEESRKNKTIVLLVFARTDTRWFHDFIMKASEIRFIKARIKFSLGGDQLPNPAPAPSCLVIFRGLENGPPAISSFLQPKHRSV